MVSKSRSKSSRRWLERQHADHYVQKAKQAGFRSRAAYKLLELQEKDKLFWPGMTVLDLGAAPGGWSQVAAEKVGQNGKVVALDILPMDPIKGVDIIQGDFEQPEVMEKLLSMLGNRPVDLVISDMAPNLSGIPAVDQARAMYLADRVLELVVKILDKDGTLLIKLFQGSETEQYIAEVKQRFRQVVVRKPKASRAESREIYLLAKGVIPQI
jgi:23S rRNA (uridine2552-2'-O)-methyltransferase